MTLSELVKATASEAGVSQTTVHNVLNNAFICMGKTLATGEDVKISGFGSWKVKESAPRKARNPKTGESVEVPASHRIAFVPSGDLKEAVKAL